MINRINSFKKNARKYVTTGLVALSSLNTQAVKFARNDTVKITNKIEMTSKDSAKCIKLDSVKLAKQAKQTELNNSMDNTAVATIAAVIALCGSLCAILFKDVK